MPAIIDRSPIVVAISSGGTSPVLARRLRTKIESVLPASIGRLAALAERFRSTVKAKFPDVNQRRQFWERTLDGPVAELALSGREADATAALERALHDTDGDEHRRGRGLSRGRRVPAIRTSSPSVPCA